MKELSEIRESQARTELKLAVLENRVDNVSSKITEEITPKVDDIQQVLGKIAVSVGVLRERSQWSKRIIGIVLSVLLGGGAIGTGIYKATAETDVPVAMGPPIAEPNAIVGLRDE